jgi:Tol biopolymer transport system component
MATERWRQVEQLCHEALARPAEERAAFVASAAAGDAGLQREVESLLAQEPRAAAFMSSPAVAFVASAVLGQGDGSLVGRRFGSYVLGSRIGAGGMGEVYRAHDDALGREVAIKVLSPAFSGDADRRARFDREARLLATLNHPHIGAIYGVEEADGVRALVLELVEGETLDERMARALTTSDALAIARQIALALEAAHEKGIVHRDLKPANVKITPDGVVKVLDFGLAKPASADGIGPGLMESREGAILGTAAYMSPEQARGQSVDKRADIWAFGCVLYEMLTGRLAFPGDTASDMIAKILEREPDWSALPVGTPASVRRLLFRCLVKDPKQRLRDIGDARIEIDGMDDVLPKASGASVAPPGAPTARMRWSPWVALAALAAGVAVWEARRPAATQESPLANARFSRFTDWKGTEGAPEISPDGKFVAFQADRDGQFDIWLSQVGSGHFSNLTQGGPPLDPPGSGRLNRTFGFSADGAELWFSAPGDAGNPKMLMPITGGTPRAFLAKGSIAPSWSPDGRRLVYFNNGDGDHLLVADRAGTDAHPIVLSPKETNDAFFRKGMHNHNPIWSPDGEWIYFVHGLNPTVEMNIWRVRPAGGPAEQLTQRHASVNFLSMLDARTLLYVARGDDKSGPWLWSLDVPSRVTRRVGTGLEHYSYVSASRDGRRVVATVSRPVTDLWSAPLLDRLVLDDDVQPYRVPTARALAPRFGGTSAFYLAISARGDGDGLWRLDDGHASEIWNDAEGGLFEPAAAAPDGRRVAVVVRQEGKRHLVMMSADGTDARTLAASIDIQGEAGQGTADWSPDGRWIAAGGVDAKGPGLFKIPVDGGAPVRLIDGQAINPVWSPDGHLIVYAGPVVGGTAALLGIRPDGVRVELPPVRSGMGGSYRFLPGGTGLVYLPRAQSMDFWLLDLAARTTRPITRLSGHGALRTFDITPDGKRIVFDRSRDDSDIVLIDLPK